MSDALTDLRAFVLSYSYTEKTDEGIALLEALERAIDARVTELLEANNREVERRRKAEAELAGKA